MLIYIVVQSHDKINFFEILESLMNDMKEKTRNEDIMTVISMLQDMELSDEEIAQKISLAFSISLQKANDYIELM